MWRNYFRLVRRICVCMLLLHLLLPFRFRWTRGRKSVGAYFSQSQNKSSFFLAPKSKGVKRSDCCVWCPCHCHTTNSAWSPREGKASYRKIVEPLFSSLLVPYWVSWLVLDLDFLTLRAFVAQLFSPSFSCVCVSVCWRFHFQYIGNSIHLYRVGFCFFYNLVLAMWVWQILVVRNEKKNSC